jgi:ADP-ribosyl-[dinitrogen reductase] hydrolase
VSEELKLPDEHVKATNPNTGQSPYENHLDWAFVYFTMGRVITKSKEGVYQIAERGTKILSGGVSDITIAEAKNAEQEVPRLGGLVKLNPETLSRAEGCLLGQLAGDSLGSLVEFKSPADIRRRYPDGVREFADGGTWNTIAGQPTDDSEMALMLARMLVKFRRYDANEARKAYVFWLNSRPFDCGDTVRAGLQGAPNRDSQANGALMRISPLGIFCWNIDPESTSTFAQQDAALTHPHPVCLQANALITMAIADSISHSKSPEELYEDIKHRATEMRAEKPLLNAILNAADSGSVEYCHQRGWVLIAFQNALWQLLHAPTLEEGVVDTVMRGGDTDTNAAIAGALLGAVHGRGAIPGHWVNKLLSCRPVLGKPGVIHPRPECFWPVDALALARSLVVGGSA